MAKRREGTSGLDQARDRKSRLCLIRNQSHFSLSKCILDVFVLNFDCPAPGLILAQTRVTLRAPRLAGVITRRIILTSTGPRSRRRTSPGTP